MLANLNKPVQLHVYNTKSEQVRGKREKTSFKFKENTFKFHIIQLETSITPRQWTDNEKEVLGISIRHTAIKDANDFIWHVEVRINKNKYIFFLRNFFKISSRKFIQIHLLVQQE